jgi:hypothetical protein
MWFQLVKLGSPDLIVVAAGAPFVDARLPTQPPRLPSDGVAAHRCIVLDFAPRRCRLHPVRGKGLSHLLFLF